MMTLNSFPEVHQFIDTHLVVPGTLVLQSVYRKVHQIFVVGKDENEIFKIKDIHLINNESLVTVHFINIKPHYLAVVMGANMHSIRMRFILVDLNL